ncbi:choice-of-anchor B family protein [Flavobacteriaceae bacterium TK19130]|nr:choice-of-anchor B family protein [Thermobacterium salinum]
MKKLTYLLFLLSSTLSFSQTPCSGGLASGFPCDGITLQSRFSLAQLGASSGADSWGWTDPLDGKEYAIIALNNSTFFIDITDPINPRRLGRLMTHTSNTLWRDVKVYNNHAFIVSEANGHGMQVFDLTRLRGLSTNANRTFSEDAHLGTFGAAHNIVINESEGVAYIVGANGSGFNGGPIFVDISDPTNPSEIARYSAMGYTHDAQVVTYNGPDADYAGKEIFIGSNEDEVVILDVTNKFNVQMIATIDYTNKDYTHQGWFTEDQRYFILGDELDEQEFGFPTKTVIFDFNDLDNPVHHFDYYGPTNAIDHNGYVRGNRFYLANYGAGMRVIRIDDIANQNMTEINYFDTYASSNSATFAGAWNVYPYFESGNIIISDYSSGFYIVKDPLYDNIDPVANCQDITITLDRLTGEATLTADDIDNGSSDNFGITKKSIDITTFTCDDIGTHPVTLTVEDDYGNKSSCTATVTVVPETTAFISGTWNNGTPGPGSNAKISQNYNTDFEGSFSACTCEVDATRTLNIAAGDHIEIEKDITVNGSLFVAHEGSVVQIDPNATVTKASGGTIIVEKITPNLAERDFMILSSPMDAETRTDVYGNSVMVRNHITGNFVPNPAVAAAFPLAENFADDDGNNWVNYAGNINVGEGYLVRPQDTPTSTGIFTLHYTEGTLNNGDVSFPIVYNGSQNASPNMLGNPYASAIDADAFIAQNAMIDAIYFWEHITVPNPGYPGYNPNNYSMGDISIYNGMGGVAAANDPGTSTTPNGYIASGQGFGVKASASGTAVFTNEMRVTGNNDGYRSTSFESDRAWVKVTSMNYELGSESLIGFSDAATNEIDTQFDTKRMATPVSFYSVLPTGEELAIQGREAFEDEAQVPMGFSSQLEGMSRYRISLSNVMGENMVDAKILLVDTYLNTTTILNESIYEFESEAGTFNDRFILQFKAPEVLGVEDSVSFITIYPNPTENTLTIASPATYIRNISVFDIMGRRINETLEGDVNQHSIDVSNLETAIYFVEIKTDSGSVTKKMVKK